MMTCKQVSERASAFIDGELGVWEAMQLRMHLAMCSGCQHFIRQMRTTRDLIQSTGKSEEQKAGDDGRIDAILSKLQNGKQRGD